jgi:hypothetical protein
MELKPIVITLALIVVIGGIIIIIGNVYKGNQKVNSLAAQK